MFEIKSDVPFMAIDQAGAIHRVTISARELATPRALLEKLNGDVAKSFPRAFLVRGCACHVLMKANLAWVTVNLGARFPIRTRWHNDGTHVRPNAGTSNHEIATGSASDPVCAIDWPIPSNARFRFLVEAQAGGGGSPDWFMCSTHLGLFDVKTRERFLPPLGNIHTDGSLCLGAIRSKSATTLGGLVEILVEQLCDGSWNADLSETIQSRCSQYFRFIPDGGQFIHNPSGADWRQFCVPTSSALDDKFTHLDV